MSALKVLHASSELGPFAKSGGLADMVWGLGTWLHQQEQDVRFIIPSYDVLDPSRTLDPVTDEQTLDLGEESWSWRLLAVRTENRVPVYAVDCPNLFHRGRLYTEDSDEYLRFGLFSAITARVPKVLGWRPDLLHIHDWQTALVPLYLKEASPEPHAETPTLLTLHNVGYQGTFSAEDISKLGLENQRNAMNQERLTGGELNFLDTGILNASALTTVSRTYAQEICTPEQGHGLEGSLATRASDLTGIVNGADYSVWEPETDPTLPKNYSSERLGGKLDNKRALLHGFNLDYDDHTLCLGIVTRLAWQKGVDLILKVLPGFLDRHNCAFVALGSGDAELTSGLEELSRQFPNRAAFYNGYSENLAHLIEAGADAFLMPSRYEPCGLNQLYSMKYGTLPIVRKTGGLADTVTPHQEPSGTGFVFEHFDAGGLDWALSEAMEMWQQPEQWQGMMLRAMAADYSWEHQGPEYLDLYRRLTNTV